MDREMTDDELLNYCNSHCETPVGAFHTNHLARLGRLAGDEALAKQLEEADCILRPAEDSVKEYVQKARDRINHVSA